MNHKKQLAGKQLTATAEQRAVIEAPLAPLLVVAGAGSGKTTTMAERVAHVVATGQVSPEQVLGVTFTRKAAHELSARIRRKLAATQQRSEALDQAPTWSAEFGDPEVSTYHSYAKRIVSDYGLRIGIEPDATLLGHAQSWQLTAEVVAHYDGDLSKYDGAFSTLVDAVIQLAAECAEHLQDAHEVSQWMAVLGEQFAELPAISETEGGRAKKSGPAQKILQRKEFFQIRYHVARMVENFQAIKRHRNAVDFGDLVALATRIVQKIPEVRAAEQDKFRLVLLDEFQDTSYAQLQLFSTLYGDGHAVTAVGDPHQSIYGFRGASAGQLFRFPEMFRDAQGDPAQVLNLSTAWRNSRSVLSTANRMGKPLHEQAPTTWLLPLTPRPEAPLGEVELARFEREEQEAEAIAQKIVHRRGSVGTGDAAAASPTSTAVLCRARKQFLTIQRAFDDYGIPYEVVGLGGLLHTPEVIDLVSTLRVVVDPEGSQSLLRLLTGARWRIGSRDLLALADWSRELGKQRVPGGAAAHHQTGKSEPAEAMDAPGAKLLDAEADDSASAVDQFVEQLSPGISLVEALDLLESRPWAEHIRRLSDSGRKRLLQLSAELRKLRTAVGLDLATLVSQIERTICLDIEVAARPGSQYHQARRHLEAFATVVDDFTASAQQLGADRVDPASFLAWLEVAEDVEDALGVLPPEPMPGVVQISTIHAAKGLEWDEVYVPGLNQDSFPGGTRMLRHWATGYGSLPWPLRGDREELPVWDTSLDSQKAWLDSLEEFKAEVHQYAISEDRRLAYVAFTRAKNFLWISSSAFTGIGGYRGPSMFFTELLEMLPSSNADTEHLKSVEGTGMRLLEDVDEEALAQQSNPQQALRQQAEWPYDPLNGIRIHTVETGALVKEPRPERRVLVEEAAARVRGQLTQPPRDSKELPEISPRWGQEALRLLRLRSGAATEIKVALPPRLSVTSSMQAQQDPEAFAKQLLRPVPQAPQAAALRGTLFHSWVEEHFGKFGELELEEAAEAQELSEDIVKLRERFLQSSWAQRQPEHVEYAVETEIAGVVRTGKIDAVFRNPQGQWELVDWKTGRAPSAKRIDEMSMQLALYRIAWSRLFQEPLENIRGALYFVPDDRTIWFDHLPNSEELEQLLTPH